MRLHSTVQRLLVYATFITLSVALHMLVILGTRPASADAAAPASVGAIDTGVEPSQ
ncbi:MAG: hypothetical protein KDD82_12300 [Planctomycetes bacterium]|nr:hypothetical protein [Planctomycetota bacterium]